MTITLLASIALHVALFILLCCAAGQVVHGYLRVTHCNYDNRLMASVYEAALLAHVVVMSGTAFELARGGLGVPMVELGLGSVMSSMLWINAIVAVTVAYVSVASVPNDDDWDAYEMITRVETPLAIMCVPPVIMILGSLWYIVFAVDVLYCLARTIYVLVLDRNNSRHIVTIMSTHEALRRLPEGLIYFNEAGKIVLINDSARRCLSALGIAVNGLSIQELWDQVSNRPYSETVAHVADELHADPESRAIAQISPDEVRLFMFEGLGFGKDLDNAGGTGQTPGRARAIMSRQTMKERPAARVVALDVTDRIDMLLRIEESNELLAKSQLELQASLETVQEAAENEALLKMRGRVHDVIGQRLSMLHRALEDDAVSDKNLEQLKPLLTGILDDLAHDNRISPNEELTAIVNAFALAGIAVAVDGVLPQDEHQARLFVDCIREGATNAVKHAHARTVDVRITEHELAISNDGAPASGPITMGTGLANMLHAVAQQGGMLEVESYTSPFTLRITLP